MTEVEYAEYQRSVAAFFEGEGITNLSSGCYRCPECSEHPVMDFDANYPKCPNCGFGAYPESFFSWNPCHCCGSSLGGNREHATGYNPTTEEVQEYVVCEDCIYYAEYSRLDDQTMLDIEESTK
jgi:hypothetical protein